MNVAWPEKLMVSCGILHDDEGIEISRLHPGHVNGRVHIQSHLERQIGGSVERHDGLASSKLQLIHNEGRYLRRGLRGVEWIYFFDDVVARIQELVCVHLHNISVVVLHGEGIEGAVRLDAIVSWKIEVKGSIVLNGDLLGDGQS